MTPKTPRFQITSSTAQGSRPYQEDRLLASWIETPSFSGNLLAVFDGHRGARAADTAARLTSASFQKSLSQARGDSTLALRLLVQTLVEQTGDLEAGSTASIVFLPENGRDAFLAVLGDSPIAILDETGNIFFGADHNIRSNPRERQAAERRGAMVVSGYLEDPQSFGTGLQMARSLGDKDLDRILSREPDIEHVSLGPDSVGLVATDGILNPLEGSPAEQLERLVGRVRRGEEAQALVEDALKRQTGDNVSVLVWRRVKG